MTQPNDIFWICCSSVVAGGRFGETATYFAACQFGLFADVVARD